MAELIGHDAVVGKIETLRENGSVRVKFMCESPSLTIQSAKDDCDINKLISRYKKSGVLPPVAKGNAMYGDFSQVTDYRSALTSVMAAQEGFASLSSELRRYFDNDPAKLLMFIADSANREKAIELGLIPKPPKNVEKAPEPPAPEPQKP